ncbi:MAG: hypothetical protein HUJ70_02515 [Pseudobutyrivibrio sp.]|nr:hypothetical protein [Pseudobutyrivibrio sp.]
MDKWEDEELFEELSARADRDYDSLTEHEKNLLEQLTVEHDAMCGYFEDD